MKKVLRIFGLSLVLCLYQLVFTDSLKNQTSYARVVISGSSDGPKIYKSLHSDLLLPSVLNSTDETSATEDSKDSQLESTGRAYMDSGSFPLSSYSRYPMRPNTFNPNYRRPATIIYPAYHPPHKRIDQIMDRYTPGEAVASALFKNNKQGYKYNAPKMKPTIPEEYTPPKDLYAFPPNIDSKYSPPTKPPLEKSKNSISSYIPPPAGPANGFNGFLGPVSPDYLPPFLQNSKTKDTESAPKPDMTKGSTVNEMPSVQSLKDDMPPSSDSSDHYANHPPKEDLFPPPDLPSSDDGDDGGPPVDSAPVNTDSMEMPSDDQKPQDMDDEHMNSPGPSDHFPDHHGHSFYGSHGVDAYPEIIFDDDPHHHHPVIYDHHPEEITTTAKPEPPPEPRVKKYSYFYLGRKLWYIPLYFTVWFSFYIFWLIIKSIARHKVNLPNHYTGRMMKRNVAEEFSHKEIVANVDILTATIMSYIDDFEKKYSEEK